MSPATTRLAPRRITLIVGFGALALLLGYIGYRDPAVGQLSDLEALYRSIQLFSVEGNFPDRNLPLALEIARFLAPAVLASAAILAVFAVARERSQTLRIRFRRGHTLIIGLGRTGATIARRLHDEGRDVVVIEADASNPQALGLRTRGIPVVAGSGTDKAVLERARIAQAQRCLICAGDDSVNLGILAACVGILPEEGASGPSVFVVVEGLGLWSELHRLSFVKQRQRRIEFFSLSDRIAGRIVSAASASEEPDQVVVHGCGPVGARVVAHALRRPLLVGRKPRLSLIGPHAPALRSLLRDQEPWSLPYLVEAQELDSPEIAWVCGLPEAEALAAAAALSREFSGKVVVAVPDQDAETALRRTHFDFANVELIPAESEALSEALFDQSAIEVLARAKHDDYVEKEHERGTRVEDNEAMVPWEELHKNWRDSNRLFADSVGSKLAKMGASLLPIGGVFSKDDLTFPDDLLEEMAREEHRRWQEDLESRGWRYHAGKKNPEAKLHPLLIGWDDLSEAERQKDRDAVRGLPIYLGKLGYRMTFTTQPPAP